MNARVLWLTKGLGRGGAERLLVSSLAYIDKSRFRIDVAYLLPWKDAFVPQIEAQGVLVHCLAVRSELDPRWVVRLLRLAHEREYDLVHTHSPLPGAVARAVLPRSVPIVHTEHNTWQRYRTGTRLALRATYGRNHAAIAVSSAVADSIRRPRDNPPVETILHGPNMRAIKRGPVAREQARAEFFLDPSAEVIGTVGTLTPKKDHRTLLAALSMVVQSRPDVRLVIVGDGPLARELRTYTTELGLNRHVIFAGPRDDVFELLPAFDVFVMSSRFEGLSIALLEALATGLPCVVTAVGGMPEVVGHGREGFLVPPEDPASLSMTLLKVLDDRELREEFARNAIVRVCDFDLSSAVGRTQEIYKAALARVGR